MQRDAESVEALRAEWKRGDTVVLIEMSDPQAPPAGTRGTVEHVDDFGQVHVAWDLGGSLALVPGADRFRKLDGDADACPKCDDEQLDTLFDPDEDYGAEPASEPESTSRQR